MKRTRKITKEEREILLNMQLRSKFSLLILFYIFGLILPLLTCMIITMNFRFFYFLVIAFLLLFFVVYILPRIEKYNYKNKDISCFESEVLNTKAHDIYYYVTEINGLDNIFIDYRYPVNTRLEKGTKVIVVMLGGKGKYKDYI